MSARQPSGPPRPPRLWEWLLERLLRDHRHGDTVLGDLAQGHLQREQRRGRPFAHLWYARQALSLVLHGAGRDPGTPGGRPPATLRERLAHDVTAAARGMARRPGFTLAVSGVLAIAMAATLAAFSVTVGTFEAARGWRAPERTVLVWPEEGQSLGQLTTLQQESQVFETLGAWVAQPAVIALDDGGETTSAVLLSPALFDALSARPVLGRGLAEDDGQVGAEPVMVLGRGLWTRVFGADPGVVGRVIEVNGVSRRVVGVMGAGAAHPVPGTELWLPLVMDPFDPDFWPRRDLTAAGVLQPGVSLQAAREDVVRVFGILAARFPFFYRPDFGRDATVALAGERSWGGVATPLLLLLAGTALLLLVAAIDVGNLVLARTLERDAELRVRAAVGASRGQVIQQIWIDAALRAALAGGMGWLGGRAVASLLPRLFPRGTLVVAAEASAPQVLAFLAAVTALAWVLMAGIPSLHFLASTNAGLRPRADRGRAPGALVVTQAGLAMVLLVTAGLLLRTVWSLSTVELGFRPEGVTAVSVAPRGEDFGPARMAQLRDRLSERMTGGAGFTASGWISAVPLLDPVPSAPVNLEERPAEVATATKALQVVADEGALAALGIEVVQGRSFTPLDREDTDPVVLVSRAMAATLWPGEDALGRRIAVDPHAWDRFLTVVGVVEDVRFQGLAVPAGPVFYQSPRQTAATAMTMVARSTGGGGAVAQAVRAGLAELAPAVPAGGAREMTAVVRDAQGTARVMMSLLGALAGAATLLGALGLYGVLAGWVARRRPEIGMRLALGASPGRLALGVLRTGAALTATGVVLGSLGGAWAGRAVGSLLYGVSSLDPLAFGLPAVVLVVTSVLAAAVPAIRTARVDPARALGER